ncbi:hypothetical protein [uncultured Methanolobus sp.]|uniref:hypothetical protein n=1 Tax=uncultured Methanolobus sp. TaxID=218300 RepID=UPI0029C95362|nr:hypothetical protein [uncultured Methanolobus sp.]
MAYPLQHFSSRRNSLEAFIAEYYSKMQNNLREKQVEETAELVIEKLREKKLV